MKKSVVFSSSLLLPLHLFLFVLSLTNGCPLPARKDACHPNPCQNGGSCTVVETLDGESSSCSCVGGNHGKDDYCNPMPTTTEATTGPCEPNPCEADGECFEDPYHEMSSLDFYCMCGSDREGERCETETGRFGDDFNPFPSDSGTE